jgi:phage gp29-like protein
MAQRFKTAPVPTGEVARYTSDPYNLSSIYMFGSSSPFTGQGNTIVRPNDDLLLAKGGNRALVVYQRLLHDEQVQGCFSKLMQEVTSRPWYIQQYSDKPGDLAVRDFVAEVLEEMPLDDIYKGMAESMIAGFSVGEVMWKKTKRGVIPFDVRMRDQRRFVFQESEDAETGFTMRCLTYNRMFEGVELPQRKFIVNRYYVQHNGDPYGSALGRILYPLVKFRRRAIESYVLFGDRYATPTAVAKAPLSASTRELDTLYGHLSNLSQETAMILPEGYELEFVVPSGSPEVFKNLIDYIDKEISLVVCGEDEAGRAEAGSRASSQVANTIRVVRASEISEMLSHTLSQTLVRWIVDLNFGTDVAAPTLTREFRIEESAITVPDLSLLIQSGFTPRKEWIERHFRVELEEKKAGEEEAEATQFDPQKDQDLFGSIFGDQSGAQASGGEQAAGQEMEAAADVMEEPAGAAPEESQAGAIGEPSAEDQLAGLEEEGGSIDDELDFLWGDEPEESPFGDEKITEDEAVDLSRKEG